MNDSTTFPGNLSDPPAPHTPTDPQPEQSAWATAYNASIDAARARFFPQQTITDARRDDLDTIREFAVGLGAAIERLVPVGRNKSLALTALEDSLMRATRGVAAPEGSK